MTIEPLSQCLVQPHHTFRAHMCPSVHPCTVGIPSSICELIPFMDPGTNNSLFGHTWAHLSFCLPTRNPQESPRKQTKRMSTPQNSCDTWKSKLQIVVVTLLGSAWVFCISPSTFSQHPNLACHLDVTLLDHLRVDQCSSWRSQNSRSQYPHFQAALQ